ncbi:hypothetical protein EJ419_01410 [Alloscardovia theropitheci]|uniref:Beta-carotene 15,15'-monooxygenase n=1 Tax=Alloscardovia theropitheci TaxID=2496842 RepID=A0A4R0QR13_9BIFI|nr:DUF6350 family protein [Alloscardovia theropitheci]TCD54783.1 hypothetical protein EJ419_01410 [Alloscardovia theropitheci]
MARGRSISSASITPGEENASKSSSASQRIVLINRGRDFLRGILTAIFAMGLYALSLLLFVSLFILVASMETGVDLSTVNYSFTAVLIVLSQGISIQTDALAISIIPLGLTVYSVIILRLLMIRRRTQLLGYVATAVVWVSLVAGISYVIRDFITSSIVEIIVHPLIVFAVAFVLSCTRDSIVYQAIRKKITTYWSASIQKNISLGLRTSRRLILTYCGIALITAVVWIVRGFASMQAVFAMTHMGIGAQIMSSILTLAWLPNLLIWALAWTLGATLNIGTLGTFNLWIGQSNNLPPIPVFGLFPEPITSSIARTVTLVVPIIIVACIGLYCLVRKNEYGLLKPEHSVQGVLAYIYPIGSFIISVIVTIIVSAFAITLSSGSLGSKNLSHLGLTVSSSLNNFGRPVQWGLLAAWLIIIVVGLAQFSISYLRSYFIHRVELNNELDDELDTNPENDLEETDISTTHHDRTTVSVDSEETVLSDQSTTKPEENHE